MSAKKAILTSSDLIEQVGNLGSKKLNTGVHFNGIDVVTLGNMFAVQ